MTSLKTTPLTESFGVIVHDLDLADVTKDHLFPELRALFEEHSAILVKGQDLPGDVHLRLAKMFGPVEDRLSDERKEGYKEEVRPVSNVTDSGALSGEMDMHTLHLIANQQWHIDSTFIPTPSLINILTAKVPTDEGGETELASTRAAFAALSPEQQEDLRGMKFWHKYSHSRERISPELAKHPMFHKWPPQCWPAIWDNPVNGKEGVFVASHVYQIEGKSTEESQPFIDALIEHCTQPQFTYSHKWEKGDVLMWDQRATLHRGMPWDLSKPRHLDSVCVSMTDADGLGTARAAVAA